MRDSEVVASIVAGDPAGLVTAYDRYADPLYKYCRTLLSDPADAADAVQDTFVITASRLDGLCSPDWLRPWLYAVARNEAFRIPRSKEETSAPDRAPYVTGDSAEYAERANLRTLFEDASGGLNPGEREVIELQLRQGLEPAEVAVVLGVSRNHAFTLLSRARDQLRACLAVLLVGRAGRGECDELAAMLSGWDGRLTAALRKRVHRHIEHCSTCGARAAFALNPSMLLDLSPGAALAAGAAASFRFAADAPDGLRAHTLAIATGQGPSATAHRAVVLGRAGSFTSRGFPKPAHGAGKAWLAGHHVADGVKALRSSPQRQGQAAAASAVVLAVIIAATAFALAGNSGSVKAAADPKPPAASAAVVVRSPKPTPHRPKPVPHKPASATPAPPSSPASAATTPSPGMSQYPAGGTQQAPEELALAPGGQGTQVYLGASGSGDWAVNWSATVANDPGNAVSIGPASSGTLTPADPYVALTVTVSQYLVCGPGFSACPTITLSPSGAVFSVWTGWSDPFHDPGPGSGSGHGPGHGRGH